MTIMWARYIGSWVSLLWELRCLPSIFTSWDASYDGLAATKRDDRARSDLNLAVTERVRRFRMSNDTSGVGGTAGVGFFRRDFRNRPNPEMGVFNPILPFGSTSTISAAKLSGPLLPPMADSVANRR
jgi:hypothetical protein